jgi:hypothetical protein
MFVIVYIIYINSVYIYPYLNPNIIYLFSLHLYEYEVQNMITLQYSQTLFLSKFKGPMILLRNMQIF